MKVLALTLPIRPGREERWRQFIQEMGGLRRSQHDAARQRMGIVRELIWLVETPQGELAFFYLETDDPTSLLAALATSEAAFDRWFRRQILDLHGLDLGRMEGTAAELIFTWQS